MNIKLKLFGSDIAEVDSRPKWRRCLDADTIEGQHFAKQATHLGMLSGALSAIIGLGVSIVSGYREIKRDNKR